MADLKSATPKTPETGMKLYATDKKLNFVPQCNLMIHTFDDAYVSIICFSNRI